MNSNGRIERWCDSWLVTLPVSYTYNGGVSNNGKWYSGFKVNSPKPPDGFELVGVGSGLQLNARPPHKKYYLKPVDGHKVTRYEAEMIVASIQKLQERL